MAMCNDLNSTQAHSQPIFEGVLRARRSQHREGGFRPRHMAVLRKGPGGVRPLPVAGVRGYHPEKLFETENP